MLPYLDMGTESCPAGWTLTDYTKRTCNCATVAMTLNRWDSVTFPVTETYSTVCGRIVIYVCIWRPGCICKFYHTGFYKCWESFVELSFIKACLLSTYGHFLLAYQQIRLHHELTGSCTTVMQTQLVVFHQLHLLLAITFLQVTIFLTPLLENVQLGFYGEDVYYGMVRTVFQPPTAAVNSITPQLHHRPGTQSH